MQSIVVSWLCMRQHLPVIPLKLDGSTAVQEGKMSKSHHPKRGKHQLLKEQKGTRSDSCASRNASTRSSCIVLHKHPRSGSSLWIIPPGYLNASHCPSLEACWSIPVQKQFKSILIVHTTWFLCEDPIHSKEVEMGLQAFTRVCTIHFWFLFTNLTSCYCCVFPLTVTFSTYFQALRKLGLQFRVNCKMSRA